MRISRRLKIALIVVASGASLCVAILALPPFRHGVRSVIPVSWLNAAEAYRDNIDIDHSLRLRMADGVELATSVYLPKQADRPLATVLIRLPYGRRADGYTVGASMYFARQGFAVVAQDLRGTGDSGGELLPWRDVADDGGATLDWIKAQSWSNGKVGTFGCSALGETQLVLASRNHPAHAALIAGGAGGAIGTMHGQYGYFGLYEGGVFELASGFGWFVQHGSKDPRAAPAKDFDTARVLQQLPISTMVAKVRPAPSGYSDFLSTPLGDPRWEKLGYLTDKDSIRVPALILNTWSDQTVGDALIVAEHMRQKVPEAARDQRVIIAPGTHCGYEATALPYAEDAWGAASSNYFDWYLRWFDHWLRNKGDGLTKFAPYTYYMLDEKRWYQSTSWPPREARAFRWYLGSGGRANSASGDGSLSLSVAGELQTDRFEYDPLDPVPSRGGPVCCTGDPNLETGVVDQALIERRPDVLVYTSPPLDQELRIAGPLKVSLVVSSDVPDTDIIARLADVTPEGKSLNIQEGALRLRYRDGLPARFMQPGVKYEISIDLRSIAYRISKGHRLRLDVTSSSFPRLERNLNTGGNNFDEATGRKAITAIHHGPDMKAYVDLMAL